MAIYPNNYQVPVTPGNMWNYTTPQPTQPNPNGGFVWVQGEEAAKAYPVAPGNKVLLMDSDNPVLYVKTADNTGRPMPLETYDLVLRVNKIPEPSSDLSSYVRKDEIEELIVAALNDIRSKKKARKDGDENA